MNTTYESKEDLTYEVKVICVNARRIYFVQKSNHHDVIYACNNCEFLVVGHFNGEFWTVVESNLTHTCPEPTVEERKKNMAYTPRDIAKFILEQVRADPEVTPKLLIQSAKKMPGEPDIQYHHAQRAREKAIEMAFGDPIVTFRLFPGWKTRMEEADCDNVVEVDSYQGRYERSFVAVGCHRRAFNKHVPLVNVDGTRCRYGGECNGPTSSSCS
jgi:hypothetical protein